ncbi:subclass B1 metallo-beta-lactamase [Cecembia rubra]|uniref:subclass B1 metallo-beta-lactamase n=1 Tax=Cecembia rubra TaxID=1485585 RepID=UPI002714CCD7|nr:subclass B1 metallo-beta-lactamase [Cecembia rubra]
MKTSIQILLILFFSFSFLNCKNSAYELIFPEEVYQSDALVVTRISENAYIHTSYLKTNDFGNVACNGLVVTSGKEAYVFDTPTENSSSGELIEWIQSSLGLEIKGIMPTHFHNDCLGGLQEFEAKGIPSYASNHTIQLAQENNLILPQKGFGDSILLELGDKTILAKYFGEGHTQDNVVVYFPSEKVLFGGCLIKELNATKGFLGDANVTTWSSTVEKIKIRFPDTKIVVPGHGQYGNAELLDYTINLFKTRHFGEK